MNSFWNNTESSLQGWKFYLILISILLLGLFFRTLYLDADPPIGITHSQDFSTDPPQYTYFAKNYIQWGDSNPLNDPRFSQWMKSSQNLLALGIYSIFGTSRISGNLVGVVFNLLSILFLALAIKNFGSRLGALFFALIASVNFTLIFFARVPFLEASQNFWLCLSVYFFSKAGEKWIFLILTGMACAIAAFFGKMIALFMFGTFTLLFVKIYFVKIAEKKETFKNALYYYSGFLFVVLIWLVVIYLPSRGEFSGYLSEQAIGLYGAPKALDSLADFFWQIYSLLWDREFFNKFPFITILAFLFGNGVLVSYVKGYFSKEKDKQVNQGWLLLLFWCSIGFIALFPWNYRPLRYQTTLMFPTMAMAALALSSVCSYVSAKIKSQKKKVTEKKPKEAFFLAVVWGIWLLPLIALLFFWSSSGKNINQLAATVKDNYIFYTFLMFLVGAVGAFIVSYIKFPLKKIAPIASILATILLVVILSHNLIKFSDWTTSRQYSLRNADKDIAAILGKDAIPSGPYAPALTQDNDYKSLIHMFGVKRVDKELFTKYPVTHLLMDEGNEKRARQDYPKLMSKAISIARYNIRGYSVRLYNISQASLNPQAQRYQLSDYELMQKYITDNKADTAQVYLQNFIAQEIPNYTANYYIGDALSKSGRYNEALIYYQQALEFAERDPMLYFVIGNIYQQNNTNIDSALVYYKKAAVYFPDDNRLAAQIEQLERIK